MLNVVAKINERRKMEILVDSGELTDAKTVARFFEAYTLLIWDYLLVGKIYDCYNDDVILNHAGGVTVQGIDTVIKNTLGIIASVAKDNQTVFIDIFAEGNEEEGYRFCQLTTAYSPLANKKMGDYVPPQNRVYLDEEVGGVGICECLVKKVDGRWKIVEEWLIRTPRKC
jgi:hypothetical protein